MPGKQRVKYFIVCHLRSNFLAKEEIKIPASKGPIVLPFLLKLNWHFNKCLLTAFRIVKNKTIGYLLLVCHLRCEYALINHREYFFQLLPKFGRVFVCMYPCIYVCMVLLRLQPHHSTYSFETLAQHSSCDYLKTVFSNF